jgi:HlyD family secretion protein
MDHGVLMGHVSTVSPAAVQDARLEMVYRAHGSLDTWHFVIADNTYPIRPGMTATAEIITEKRSIFSILFQKAKRRKN